MKVIDHTPFFGADGKISAIDRAKATMKLGAAWVEETQAQVGVMAALERGLDRKFTLLRNITLPGLDVRIPFILVGPTGVYVLYVTALRGAYRAKGDVWETLAGNTFKPASANLLTRTARMARAVQVYLERQGYAGVGTVEAALLCADPGLHVDSIRPIVRVVQADALERFAVSIAQARVTLSPEAVAEVVDRILNPKPSKPAQEAAAPLPPAAPETAPKPEEEEPYVPAFALPGGAAPAIPTEQPAGEQALWVDKAPEPSIQEERQKFEFHEEAAPRDETPFGARPPRRSAARLPARRRRGMSGRQWAVLIFFAILECLMVAAFLYYIVYIQNL